MTTYLIPIAISSQLDVTGEERIHAAGYATLIRPGYYNLLGHLPEGCVGNEGTYQYEVITQDTPAVVTLIAGSLPPGATIDTNGLVTYLYTEDGTYSWTLQMVDAAGNVDTLDDTVVIDPMTVEGDLPDGYLFGLSYDELVLADNPIAWWRLNDTSGTTAVDSVGSNDGTFSGSYVLDDTEIRQGGGNAASFALTGLVYVPPNPALDFDLSQPYTIEAWYKVGTRASGGTSAFIFANMVSSTYGYANASMYVTGFYGPPASLTASFSESPSTTPISLTSPEDSPDGEIIHAVWTYDPVNGMNLYQNGELVDSGSASGLSGVMGPANAHFIGGDASYPSSYGFNGNISDVILYRSELSAAAVQAHYEAGAL